jgi:hypothetical protein
MNSDEITNLVEAVEAGIRDAPVDYLTDLTLRTWGLCDYHPYFDFYTVSATIDRLETASLAGVPDAAKHLHDIAVNATQALQRIALHCSEPCTDQLGPGRPSESNESGQFEKDVFLSHLRALAKSLKQLKNDQLKRLHTGILNQEKQGPPNFTFASLLFPSEHLPTSRERMAADILSSMICNRLNKACRELASELAAESLAWPVLELNTVEVTNYWKKQFPVPTIFGTRTGIKRGSSSGRPRDMSPISTTGFAFMLFDSMMAYRQSHRRLNDFDITRLKGQHDLGEQAVKKYDPETFTNEEQKLDHMLNPSDPHAASTFVSNYKNDQAQPEYFRHYLNSRWQWKAYELPALTLNKGTLNLWTDAAMAYLDYCFGNSYTKDNLPKFATKVVEDSKDGDSRKTLKQVMRAKLKEGFERLAKDVDQGVSKCARELQPHRMSANSNEFKEIVDSNLGGLIDKLMTSCSRVGGPQDLASLKSMFVENLSGAMSASDS